MHILVQHRLFSDSVEWVWKWKQQQKEEEEAIRYQKYTKMRRRYN